MKYTPTVLIAILFCFPASAQYTRFLPNQLSVQHGGGIGWLSVGLGYKNQHDTWNISLHYGYVPKDKGGELDIFTLKAGYNPFTIRTFKNVIWKPVNPVVFISYTSNKYFYTSWPSRYPDDYYWWSSAFRTHVGLQSSLSFTLPAKACAQSASVYVEMSSNDLYISSYLTNRKTLSLWDISVFAAGVKLQLR